MDWIKSHYERALSGLMAVVLLASSIVIVLKCMDFPTQFAGMNSTKPRNNTIKPLPVGTLGDAMSSIKQPKTWQTTHKGSLLVSRYYALVDGKLKSPESSGEPFHEPITNDWVIKYELDFADPELGTRDPDQDHFSNLDEFNAGTNPIDPKSVPGYISKLRLAKYIAKPFRLIFKGTPDEGETFTINTRDINSPTLFLKLGDRIPGTPYKVLSYEKKMEVRNEIEVNTSELIIANEETNQKITLVFNKEANDPTSFAEFRYLYDNSTFKVKKDDDFTLVPEPDHKYKLIDISEAEAVVKDLKSGVDVKIPPLK